MLYVGCMFGMVGNVCVVFDFVGGDCGDLVCGGSCVVGVEIDGCFF